MPRHVATPGAIVAVTAEDDRYASARHVAARLAKERDRPVILYDFDAASAFEEPLPTWWSSDGWENRFPDRLDDQQLDAAGRGPIANQVRELRAAGVEAFGWLPSEKGPDALAGYVNDQGASTVVVPRDVAELDGLEALLAGASGADPVEAGARAAAEVVIA